MHLLFSLFSHDDKAYRHSKLASMGSIKVLFCSVEVYVKIYVTDLINSDVSVAVPERRLTFASATSTTPTITIAPRQTTHSCYSFTETVSYSGISKFLTYPHLISAPRYLELRVLDSALPTTNKLPGQSSGRLCPSGRERNSSPVQRPKGMFSTLHLKFAG